jgi:nicotianamine synthase
MLRARPEQAMGPGPARDADDVASIAAQLACTDLRPGPLVNALFGRLVAAALSLGHDHPVTRCPHLVETVRQLCALGESRLEREWAQRIIADPASLAGFPYLDNYRRLVAGEYSAIRTALGREPAHLVFAGAGPLPLTAVLLARIAPRPVITCLDRDQAALSLGEAVARALLPASATLRFAHADAAAFDYRDSDVTVLAALAGTTLSSKRALLTRMATTLRRDALLAARSVPRDGRRLLYSRITTDAVPAILEVVNEWSPPPGVINSLLLMRRRPPVI